MNAAWAAQRVPDGHFAVVHNVFVLREIDLNDKVNYRYSANMIDVAKSWGAYKDGDAFDFAKVFSGGE
jgi:dipeptidase